LGRKCSAAFVGLGGSAERVGAFEIRGADEEDVAFLLTLKSLHCVYVVVYTIALRADVELFEQRFDDEPAADGAAYGRAGHGINSGVMADSTPVLNQTQYLQMIAIATAPSRTTFRQSFCETLPKFKRRGEGLSRQGTTER